MNGQPTAENTRECGADGDLPGFRNWANPVHIDELARLWNVDPLVIPHWAPPTHAMQLWRYVDQGSIDFLWISATNPAVSLPELPRIRDILAKDDLFLVVQDGLLTETAQYADVVLPAALWGEKQGTFTNASRTIHLSEQAVDPPGQARSDLAIFLDYAHRMDFRDTDDRLLIRWSTPEEAFEAWKDCSRGRPCDYSALTYDALRGGSGIPWPCTADAPDGTDRLYADWVFPTEPDVCEDYGHDLLTGASTTPDKYKATAPGGRAFLKAAEYTTAPEHPTAEFPLIATTGRSPYHFHTRTKTGRAPRLRAAEPKVWVELSKPDADRLGLHQGERAVVESGRGQVEAEVRIGEPREGVVFLPFHFGYWDNESGPPTAANELTVTEWDPVSKQPMFKVQRCGSGRQVTDMHLATYLGLLHHAEHTLASAFEEVGSKHRDEPDVEQTCRMLSGQAFSHEERLTPIVERYGEERETEPERLKAAEFTGTRSGGVGLLRDLQDLYSLASFVDISWTSSARPRRACAISTCSTRSPPARRRQPPSWPGCRPASSKQHPKHSSQPAEARVSAADSGVGQAARTVAPGPLLRPDTAGGPVATIGSPGVTRRGRVEQVVGGREDEGHDGSHRSHRSAGCSYRGTAGDRDGDDQA
jgi:hypothetical protein